MSNLQRLAAIFFLCLVLLACSGGDKAESGVPVSDFPMMGASELDQYLKDNQGKATMLMFWTTWCPSCKQAFPDLEKLSQTHGDTVNVISVSLDESKEALASYFKGKQPSVPVYWGDQAVAAKFNVEAIPTMVFFNKQGEPVFAKPGAFPYDMLVALAGKLDAE
jgi:thiol-disulfide isomerase/thioredoxin